MIEDCYIGNIYYSFDGFITDLGRLSLSALGEPLAGLIVAWTAVVFAWKIIRDGIMRGGGELAYADAMAYTIIPIFVIGILATGATDQWYWPLFEGLKDFGPWAASAFLGEIGGIDYSGTGVGGLMCAIEKNVFEGFAKFTETIFSDIDLLDSMVFVVGCFLLVIPFAILLWELQKGILFSYMKIQAIGILSPFIIFCLAFNQTRPIVTHGVKIMVTSGLELLLCASSIAMVLHLANELNALFGPDANSGSYVIFGSDYWNLLFTSILLLFTYKALVGVAQQLMQVVGDTASDAIQPARDIGQAVGFIGGAGAAAAGAASMTTAVAAGIKLAAKKGKNLMGGP